MNLIDNFEKVLNEYLDEKNKGFKENPMGVTVRKEIRNNLEEYLNTDKYFIKGSVGQGQWAVIPWVCIFDKRITTTATKGYYIVILFQADMSGFYLSLNQGWTYYRDKYPKRKIAKEKIQNISTMLQEKLQEIPSKFTNEPINLKSNADLPEGYELGNIISRYYSKDSLPTNREILKDIEDLLVMYEQIYYLIGENRYFESLNTELLAHDDRKFIENEKEEEVFQKDIEEVLKSKQNVIVEEETSKRPDPIESKNGQKRWPRDSEIAANAIIKANYKCEIDSKHETFISHKTNHPYMEAHHLVPMKFQNKFSNNIDKTANIKSLCPICHRKIHSGIPSEKEELVVKLYNQSKEELKKVGIIIDLLELKELYGI